MNKCPYWTDAHFATLAQTTTFSELGALMIAILSQYPEQAKGNIIQVCGPISTGGFNCRETNLRVFNGAICQLRFAGMHVLDQTPLEDKIGELARMWRSANPQSVYCWPVLEDVYLPLFNSGLIGTLMFLPGWEGSVGTCWERAQGLARGIKIANYPRVLYDEFLSQLGLSLS